MESIEEATARVYFGEFSPDFLNALIEKENPESLLIQKTFFDELSKEGKILVKIILDLPEEFFLESGKIKKTVFEKYMTKILQWKRGEVRKTQKELQKYLLNMI